MLLIVLNARNVWLLAALGWIRLVVIGGNISQNWDRLENVPFWHGQVLPASNLTSLWVDADCLWWVVSGCICTALEQVWVIYLYNCAIVCVPKSTEMCTKKRVAPRTDPWGTPSYIDMGSGAVALNHYLHRLVPQVFWYPSAEAIGHTKIWKHADAYHTI